MRLALDFANSTTGRGTDHFVEHLFDYEDLLRWSVFNELLTPEAAAALQARVSPDEQACRVRRGDACAGAAEPPCSTRWPTAGRRTRALRHARRPRQGGASGRRSCARAGPAYAWRFEPPDARPDGLLGPILRSAVEVLTRRDLSRLKACPGEHCGWVFLDPTKNGARVWCEMEVCGTRAKLAQARRKAAGRTVRQDT